MKKLFILISIVCFGLLQWHEVSAKHIVGGDITYRRLATVPGGARFEIALKIYRDSSSNVFFDNSILVGIFERNTNIRKDSIEIDTTSFGNLVLTGSDCLAPPEVTVDYCLYIDTIVLPNNPNGYYIMWERCCRNAAIINLQSPDDTGIAFYCEMPNPATINNSPYFANDPFPFMCENQNFVYDFHANDADGDALTYEIVTPYAGFLGYPTNPTPQAIAGILNSGPYPNAIWQSGFSVANVCGSITPLTVNPTTGLLSLKAENQGIYAMALVVHEFRGGIEIGSIRREIEFNVIICNGNAAPVVSFSSINSSNPDVGSGVISNHAVTFEIYETDSLCFNLTATDTDSMLITYSGDIFPGSGITPPYAIANNSIGQGSINTGFCWTTNCNHSRNNPYSVIYHVTDNGCPLNFEAFDTVYINVMPIPQISPANILCMELPDNNSIKVFFGNTFTTNRFFNYYVIWRSKNGAAFTPVDTVYNLAADNFFDASTPNNTVDDYCYYMVGYNKCGEQGIPSDTLCSINALNVSANYLVTASVTDNSKIQLNWEHFDNGPFSTFYFNRKDGEGDGYSPFLTLTAPVQDSIIDAAVNVNEKYYCYTLINQDYCGNLSPESNEACTVYLQGISLPLQNKLNWSEYKQWGGNVKQYEIWRSTSVNPVFSLVAQLSASELTYTDDDLPANAGTFNYYIISREDAGSFDASSTSNEITLEQQPSQFIPNAFSPNNDGVNEQWFAVSSFVKDYSVSVFNRWGNLVFESNNPSIKWDGNFKGNPAPSGTYLYLIKYTGYHDSSEKILKGQVAIVR
jgi:gliding motility-associated-like protein